MAKNKQYNSDFSIYYITCIWGVDIITMQYSNASNVTAFDGYSDTVLAQADGGGYCKKSHALANALSKKYGLDFEGQEQGVDIVIERAREKGFTVYDSNAVVSLIDKQDRL